MSEAASKHASAEWWPSDSTTTTRHPQQKRHTGEGANTNSRGIKQPKGAQPNKRHPGEGAGTN
ncbi:MAG: hypothetical protein K2I52_03245, partial [Muribaculaceae bacterium]|nr:hypothetical protein [Muribaculaceae bacterium]